jgi:hypothetical protein
MAAVLLLLDQQKQAWQEWNAPLWDQPLELFDAMFTAGVPPATAPT